MSEHYRTVADLPAQIPVFPLSGVILLPRANLPLNVFEPRYLDMVNDVLAGDRVIGIIQPVGRVAETASPGNEAALKTTGCAGRLTAFSETDDGRYLITLTGIARFRCRTEAPAEAAYRVFSADFEPFAEDLVEGLGEDDVDRERLLLTLRSYLRARELSADWDRIEESTNEYLVNTLSMMSPYGIEEKQALLESSDLKTRADILIALAEMELASSSSGTAGSSIQ